MKRPGKVYDNIGLTNEFEGACRIQRIHQDFACAQRPGSSYNGIGLGIPVPQSLQDGLADVAIGSGNDDPRGHFFPGSVEGSFVEYGKFLKLNIVRCFRDHGKEALKPLEILLGNTLR